MAIGNDLLELKNAATSAACAADERDGRGAGWFILSWLAGFAAGMTGIGLILSTLLRGDLWFAAGGVVLIALSVGFFKLPTMIQRADKELTRLNEVSAAAHKVYFDATLAEAVAYGIDVETRTDHTDYMEDAYEFTALRNGDPIDVTVRDFNKEIVFMLNGERMQKPVTV